MIAHCTSVCREIQSQSDVKYYTHRLGYVECFRLVARLFLITAERKEVNELHRQYTAPPAAAAITH